MTETLSADFMNSDARLDGMAWHVIEQSGQKIRPGIYIAKVLVKSLQDGAKNEKYRKLIIIN